MGISGKKNDFIQKEHFVTRYVSRRQDELDGQQELNIYL